MQNGLTTERWLDVVGYEGYYSVSNLGRVRRDAPGQRTRVGFILKPLCWGGRYLHVRLSRGSAKQMKCVAHLVCESFIGPRPSKYEVNHKDGDKTNNLLENLEYVTSSGNKRHGVVLGLYASGERHYTAKLTCKQVRKLRHLRETGVGLKELGERFGIALPTVWRVVAYRSYRNCV